MKIFYIMVTIMLVIGVIGLFQEITKPKCISYDASYDTLKDICHKFGGELGFWGNTCVMPVCQLKDGTIVNMYPE